VRPARPPGGSPADTCFYIGDIGDNRARRDDVVIVRVVEPDLASAATGPVPAEESRYTYPRRSAERRGDVPRPGLVTADRDQADRGRRSPAPGVPANPAAGEVVFVRQFRPPVAQRPFRTLFTGNVMTDLAGTPGPGVATDL
jgi:hypothetical protein